MKQVRNLLVKLDPEADLALDTSENMALGQGGVITGWITVKSKNTIHDGARSQSMLVWAIWCELLKK